MSEAGPIPHTHTHTHTDEWEEMCIVAVGEAVSKMFRETDFQNLLSSLHMQPPSNTVRLLFTFLFVVVYTQIVSLKPNFQ